jgi:hypothetical protein
MASISAASSGPAQATGAVSAMQQLGQAHGHGLQRVLGLELAFGGAAQVRGDHDGRTGVQREADGGHAGADARVFGDAALLVLRHVEVGADEDALAFGAALRAEVGEADEGGHVGNPGFCGQTRGL